MTPAIAQLRLLPDILQQADAALWAHLSSTEPFFALSGTLTMYAHDITTLGEITRLFDVLLARDPVFTVYLFAAIVLRRRAELFDMPAEEPEMLHSILSKLPTPLSLDARIAEAADLLRRFPPEGLPSWRHISRYSVLKTARAGAPPPRGVARGMPPLEQGRLLFERQVAELQSAEARDRARQWLWRHRRPVRTVSVAILVGVLAVLLRKGSLPGPVLSGVGYVSGLLERWWC